MNNMSIQKNSKNALKWACYHMVYPLIYKLGSLRPIKENKIVMIEVRDQKLGSGFQRIYEELTGNYNCIVKSCFLQWQMGSEGHYLISSMSMLWELSNAKAAFITDACNVLSAFHKRKGTTIINLWHGCGAFKKFGFSTSTDEEKWGVSLREMERYPLYHNLDYLTVSSQEVVWAYEDATHLKRDSIVPVGISRTDVFFDEDFVRKAREKLYSALPSERNKKIILYAPTFRGRVKEARTGEQFDYIRFQKALSEDYILLVKHHPFVKHYPQIPDEAGHFAFDMTHRFTIEELMCVCDVCITDYSSLIFEYALLEKPLIFYAYDLEEYDDFRGFYYSYEEMTPGPVLKREEDVIQYILQLDEKFDVEEMRKFRKKFMEACDGHATQRIMDLAFGKDLEGFRKEEGR